MSRRLTQTEIEEARLVFGSSIQYAEIRVFEGARWPDWLARIAAWFARTPAPTHNAVTLGNRLFFPLALRTASLEDGGFVLQDMAWLIHEITHAWQYQRQGWKYLWQAIRVQLKMGARSYNYGWEHGLHEARLRGDSLFAFNPEQQGDIARHYYYRYKQGLDTRAWEPFVTSFKVPLPRSS
ncbi:MAG: hypothetical protein PVH60_04345 [Anaerolineales bacterium]|jgi:hypothetical protein